MTVLAAALVTVLAVVEILVLVVVEMAVHRRVELAMDALPIVGAAVATIVGVWLMPQEKETDFG